MSPERQGCPGGVPTRGRGVVPFPLIYIGGGMSIGHKISTVAFQNNAWEKGKPGTLTVLLGASRGAGGLFHPARL